MHVLNVYMYFLVSDLTTEFLIILDKAPNKLRKKIMTWKVMSV